MIRHILLMLLALLPCVRAAEADREAAVNEILARLPLRLRTRLMLGGNYNDPGQGKGIFNQTSACARKEGMPFLNLSDGPMGVNALGSGTSFGSGLTSLQPGTGSWSARSAKHWERRRWPKTCR